MAQGSLDGFAQGFGPAYQASLAAVQNARQLALQRRDVESQAGLRTAQVAQIQDQTAGERELRPLRTQQAQVNLDASREGLDEQRATRGLRRRSAEAEVGRVEATTRLTEAQSLIEQERAGTITAENKARLDLLMAQLRGMNQQVAEAEATQGARVTAAGAQARTAVAGADAAEDQVVEARATRPLRQRALENQVRSSGAAADVAVGTAGAQISRAESDAAVAARQAELADIQAKYAEQRAQIELDAQRQGMDLRSREFDQRAKESARQYLLEKARLEQGNQQFAAQILATQDGQILDLLGNLAATPNLAPSVKGDFIALANRFRRSAVAGLDASALDQVQRAIANDPDFAKALAVPQTPEGVGQMAQGLGKVMDKHLPEDDGVSTVSPSEDEMRLMQRIVTGGSGDIAVTAAQRLQATSLAGFVPHKIAQTVLARVGEEASDEDVEDALEKALGHPFVVDPNGYSYVPVPDVKQVIELVEDEGNMATPQAKNLVRLAKGELEAPDGVPGFHRALKRSSRPSSALKSIRIMSSMKEMLRDNRDEFQVWMNSYYPEQPATPELIAGFWLRHFTRDLDAESTRILGEGRRGAIR